MYIWNFVYAIFTTLIKLKGFSIGKQLNIYNIFVAPIVNGHQFVFTMGLWYVVPLFVIEVLNVLIRKILKLKIKNVNEYVLYFRYYLECLGYILHLKVIIKVFGYF